MEFFNIILPALLYVFGIILLIVLIVLGIRLIQMLDRVERLMDNVEGKVNSLNGIFSLIDKTTEGFAYVTDKFVMMATDAFSKIFQKRKKEKEEFENE